MLSLINQLIDLEDGQLFGLHLLSFHITPDELDSVPERNGVQFGLSVTRVQ